MTILFIKDFIVFCFLFLFKTDPKIHENLLALSLRYLGYPILGCQCTLSYYACLKAYNIKLYSFLSENIIYYVWKILKDAWFSRLTYFIARNMGTEIETYIHFLATFHEGMYLLVIHDLLTISGLRPIITEVTFFICVNYLMI